MAVAVVILGAGTFAVDVLEAAELSGVAVRGFLVSGPEFAAAGVHEGLPVHTPGDLPWRSDEVALVAGIVSTRRRELIEEMSRRGFSFAAIRHPTAIVSPRARVAPGAMIGAGAIVAARASIEPHAIVNRGANIGHDVCAGAYATIGPGAVIAGAVRIGSRA